MNINAPDINLSTLVPAASRQMSPTPTVRRLVVVIRDTEEENLLAGRILDVAASRDLAILLLGVSPNASSASVVRRKLVTIAALIREEQARMGASHGSAAMPEIEVKQGRDWLSEVRSLLTPEDALACCSDSSLGRSRPLHELLGAGLNLPIYTFTGSLKSPRRPGNFLSQAAAWLGSLGAIGGFFLMQVRIVLAMQGPAQSILMLLTLAGEIGCIWLLNSLLGQF